jgi:hypothetical protein
MKMDEPLGVSRMDVLRYVLEVEFSKLEKAPFDLYAGGDFETLLEALPDYHDGPRNSPAHLYAALLDEELVWSRVEIPAGELFMGPGEAGLHAEVAMEAGGRVARFVHLVRERHGGEDCFRSYFREGAIRYPVVVCTLCDYREMTPWLAEPKDGLEAMYRLQDGYHRTFQMIARGMERVPALAARRKDGCPWRGNYQHLERWDGQRWIPRQRT